MAATILIVDDEKDIRISLQGILEDEGYLVMLAADGEEAIESVRSDVPDLVLLDIWMPGKDGLETLALLKDQFPFLTVVMISGHGTIETAVKATKLGAYDFIEKPLSLEKVLITVANALRLKQLSQENSELKKTVCCQYELVGDSAQMSDVRTRVARVVQSDAAVLISGEIGTGKALLAGVLHYHGTRNEKPFITVHCSAMPESLMEMELFGYEKGAFPSATSQKKGALERADGGTLFLDEVSELSLATQARLLRALHEGSFERLGGSKCIKFSIRVISASSRELLQEIPAGRFLHDLYYQLAVVTLAMPALRERPSDIPQLAQHFICQFVKQEGCASKDIDQEALHALQEYHWPGNVRELKNYIERMLIMAQGSSITLKDVPELGHSTASGLSVQAADLVSTSFRGAREGFERDFILRKLEENDWNISRTAELIDMERSNLHRKIKSYGIDAHK